MSRTVSANAKPDASGGGADARDGSAVRWRIGDGVPLPLGVDDCGDGVNIAVFSRHATRMTLLIFGNANESEPSARVALDPPRHRTGDIWHVRLYVWAPGQRYAFQADGPQRPEDGHRFDPEAVLLDPYATFVASSAAPNEPARRSRMLSVITETRFDWAGDQRLRLTWSDTIIYETHVRGLTMHASSGVSNRGQYLGVVDKIPYFQTLGVTAVELMPVLAFDPRGIERTNPLTGERLLDYWGYNPLALFAPMAGYSEQSGAQAVLNEFRTMVRELHRAGIEIILDVVFNHTAEGDETGPTYSFRGLDNTIYYLLAADKRRYLDYTGCGNTLNCNHPVVRSMIIDCLRHWVMHFHIDGFRFDLASVLGRDSEGNLLANPPLLEQIAEDPLLRETKLIAEAWDAGGAFQVGDFPGHCWAEWNSHYRDDVRRFWRGDPGLSDRLATRLAGSSDLYAGTGHLGPVKSINFVTCHDGFTLNDLVSYSVKHNEENGENNRDGANENHSENNGVEGDTDDAAIDAMRERQVKNMLATLLLSRGVPMLLGGDEFRRTQRGNNNAYCQDNETSWYDWRLAAKRASLVRFVSHLTALRRAHPVLSRERFYTSEEIEWLGADGMAPDWHGPRNRIGCVVRGDSGSALCLLLNAAHEACRYALPSATEGWEVVIDTSQAPPLDAPDPGDRRRISVSEVRLEPRSVLVLRPGQMRRRGKTLPI